MEQKRSAWESFKIWFGIGALMFGTVCGANMASGVYATTYMVPFGGGWMWVWLLMFVVIMSFFCTVALNFIRTFKTTDYNSYYLALWNADKPETKPIVRLIISVFFDVYMTLMGIITVAATIALFASLLNSLFHVPVVVGSVIIVALFTVLSMYGAAFLRKYNVAMTIALTVCLVAILFFVTGLRGDVLLSRLVDFQTGLDWTDGTLSGHFSMFLSYCMLAVTWGGTLSNFSELIKTKKDATGAGIMIGIMSSLSYLLTALIVLPFLPEAFSETPILLICQQYLPGIMTAIYWIIVVLSVISTGPSFIFNTSNRFVKVWKNENIPQKTKLFVISLAFLLLCLLISKAGLIQICLVGYTAIGKIGFFVIGIPMLISIYRVYKKDKSAEK